MPTTSCQGTVLIVDDTPANLKVIGNFLAGAGFRILIAEDGADALEQVQTARPDIILLDVMMPEKDGYATCREIKQLEATRDVPVLFMTARSEAHEKVNGFRCGAVDYITKPYQEEDVLARIRTHLTLARQKQKLETMLAERNRFMNIAAHDLRNPLAAIIGWAEIGSSQPQANDARQMFQTIHQSAQRMQAIIEDFLSLQILKNQNSPDAGEDFDLRDVVAQVIGQQEPRAKGKKLFLLFRAGADPLPVFGNVAHTHQILTNYLSNAIKFSPPDAPILISAQASDRHVRLAVKDQGPGVSIAERGRLFAEFPKISNTPTGGESSTGLGLAIVKTLAEAQGGKVGVEFEDAIGSTFWLELPVAKQPPESLALHR